jgi:CubicO group peptidase (beta-lactamase class C family)
MADPDAATQAALGPALGAVAGWDVPNVAAAVVGSGRTLAHVGDVARRFALASVTKLLTAYACLVAVEEGTLDLDEPAGPEGSSVRHLLAHAAGYGFDSGILQPPERSRIYSNTGFDALADHLGGRAGMAATAYVTEAVLRPLAMTRTDLGDGSLAHGARSTAGDLAAFAGELLRPTLVGGGTLAEATTVQFPGLDGALPGVGSQSPNDWGLGFELRGHKAPHWTGGANSTETFGHFGAAGTFLWVDPAVDLALVVLGDRPFGPWALEAWPALSDEALAAHRHSRR